MEDNIYLMQLKERYNLIVNYPIDDEKGIKEACFIYKIIRSFCLDMNLFTLDEVNLMEEQEYKKV